LACIHCFIERVPADELTTAEVMAVIDSLAALGTLELTLTGGEPLLRPDFFAVAAYARRLHMALGLVTNGTLIDAATAQRLRELRFHSVAVSLYGPGAHDGITRRPGSWSASLRAVQELVARGLRVQVKTAVMSVNAAEIPALADWCAGLGVGFQPNPYLSRGLDGSPHPLAYRLSDEQLGCFLRWQAQAGAFVAATPGPCNAGRGLIAVGPDGQVYPCGTLRYPVGDLRRERLDAVWQRSAYLNWLRGLHAQDFVTCHTCDSAAGCDRCPGQAWEEGGSVVAAYAEACRAATKRRDIHGHTAQEALP
jgi:radical SAM protein with 4Fe4S-binding SPASM domain